MSKEEILAGYEKLSLMDKMLVLNYILYDMDSGDYSATSRDEEKWIKAFDLMINHVEDYLKVVLLDTTFTEMSIGVGEIMRGGKDENGGI